MEAKPLPKAYSPEQVEDKWYCFWIERGYFTAQADSSQKPFSIVIPPPNVTGSLHMGHALNNTLQDILVRFRRMQGFNVLWLPGTDHAGIATQNVVERMLAAEGISLLALGREKFVERVWKWKEESGHIIINQLKKLGASCDWSRERFTLDVGFSKAVQEVFIRLHREGLIYRGDYVINWCPRCRTALSDLETELKQVEGELFYIDYPLASGGGTVTVATTRPETILGDVAVAFYPGDERYQALLGQKVQLPVLGRPVPVISDGSVDPAFGTGLLKITPAHDFTDFEIGLRHDLPRLKVMDEGARMNERAGKYQGLDRERCRQAILKDIEAAGLLRKRERYLHTVGHCYRCKTVVEPYLSKQWFVKTKPLATAAIEAVKRGETVIIPRGWENTYFEWMNNIRDWCISRQIWWGHRIPAWHCADCPEIAVDSQAPGRCPGCGSENIQQETDVLDTWFSSALWPFGTLGWPEQTRELASFYPTSALVTGFDILFFWVARMMMMGIKFMGQPPFCQVYIHALVRDAEGQKMSKSKGNVIDPLDMIQRYGTDAFRFTLAALAVQGRDIKLSEERIAGYRHFANKIWNTARFSLINLAGFIPHPLMIDGEQELANRWILSRTNRIIQETTEALEAYRFSEAAGIIYQFLWHEFCDWFLEAIKPSLSQAEDIPRRQRAQAVLAWVLETLLRLLHPFMPFITEEIWQQLPHQGESITVASYPSPRGEFIDEGAEKEMGLVMDVVRAIRNVRGELSISPSKELEALLAAQSEQLLVLLKNNSRYLTPLARLSRLTIGERASSLESAVSTFASGVEIFIPLGGVINFEEELKRLTKERMKLEKELSQVEKKLADKDFLARAAQEVVEREQARSLAFKEKLERTLYWQERLQGLLKSKPG